MWGKEQLETDGTENERAGESNLGCSWLLDFGSKGTA